MGSGIVKRNATFNSASYNSGKVSGSVIFNHSSYNNLYTGKVSGSAIFTKSTYTDFFNHYLGTVYGIVDISSNIPVTFTETQGRFDSIDTRRWKFTSFPPSWSFSTTINYGNFITGSVTLLNNSYNNGTIIGTAKFRSSTYNSTGGSVSGSAEFYESSYNAYNAYITRNATFYSSSYNNGILISTATFNSASYNEGTVYGSATFNHSSHNGNYMGMGTGILYYGIFNDNTYNLGTVYINTTFNDNSYAKNSTLRNLVTFNDNSYTDANVTVYINNAIFNNNSYTSGSYSTLNAMSGSQTGSIIFNHNSYIGKGTTIVGNVTFTGNSSNRNGISHNIIPRHGGGINGSNILGIL